MKNTTEVRRMKTEQDEIDNKTPRSKFKSVMEKFEDKNDDEKTETMKNKKIVMKKENETTDDDEKLLKTTGIFVKKLNTHRESWKVENGRTPLPSGVFSLEKSAAARAETGQLFDRISRSNKLDKLAGQKENINRKRKLNFMEEAHNFSPKKLPKTALKNTFILSRLGGEPGGETQQQPKLDKMDN